MKALTVVLIICFVSLSVFSQNDKSRFSFGLGFNPNISDQLQTYSPGLKLSTAYFDSHFKLSWTTSGFFRMQIAGKFSLESGINFSNKGTANHVHLHFTDSIRDLLIASEGKYLEESHSKSNHYFIDIPFTINYTIYEGQNLTYYTRLGLITNFYVAAEHFQELYYNDGSQIKEHMHLNHSQLNENFMVKMYNLSGLLATGIEYSLNSKFGLFIEPNFDFSLFSLYNTDQKGIVQIRFYNIGVRFGFLI